METFFDALFRVIAVSDIWNWRRNDDHAGNHPFRSWNLRGGVATLLTEVVQDHGILMAFSGVGAAEVLIG